MITLDFCPSVPCAGHDCPNYQEHTQRDRTFGLGYYVEAGITVSLDYIEESLRASLLLSRPTTAAGTAHRMPDASFLIHTLREDDGSVVYEAVYCGNTPVDELLSKAPLFPDDACRRCYWLELGAPPRAANWWKHAADCPRTDGNIITEAAS